MKRPRTNESHLTCPTCWSNLDNKDLEDLAYLSRSTGPLKNDDVMNMYEEVSRLVGFLGALA